MAEIFLLKWEVQAKVDATGITFSIIESSSQEQVLEVEKIDMGKVKMIEKNDIFQEELRDHDIGKLLERY